MSDGERQLMVGQALSQSASTFVVGLVLAAVFFGFCRLAGWAYEQSERCKLRESGPLSRSAAAALEDLEARHGQEIRCMGGRRHLETPR
jgi:hypothetical protein